MCGHAHENIHAHALGKWNTETFQVFFFFVEVQGHRNSIKNILSWDMFPIPSPSQYYRCVANKVSASEKQQFWLFFFNV